MPNMIKSLRTWRVESGIPLSLFSYARRLLYACQGAVFCQVGKLHKIFVKKSLKFVQLFYPKTLDIWACLWYTIYRVKEVSKMYELKNQVNQLTTIFQDAKEAIATFTKQVNNDNILTLTDTTTGEVIATNDFGAQWIAKNFLIDLMKTLDK